MSSVAVHLGQLLTHSSCGWFLCGQGQEKVINHQFLGKKQPQKIIQARPEYLHGWRGLIPSSQQTLIEHLLGAGQWGSGTE